MSCHVIRPIVFFSRFNPFDQFHLNWSSIKSCAYGYHYMWYCCYFISFIKYFVWQKNLIMPSLRNLLAESSVVFKIFLTLQNRSISNLKSCRSFLISFSSPLISSHLFSSGTWLETVNVLFFFLVNGPSLSKSCLWAVVWNIIPTLHRYVKQSIWSVSLD